MGKPVICVDFDGVIHSYEKGWQNGQIYGTVVQGFFEWAAMVKDHFNIVIYSSRSSNPDKERQMITWLWFRYLDWTGNDKYIPVSDSMGRYVEEIKANISDVIDIFDQTFTFTNKKPPAYLTIDDRAVCFKGDWNAPDITLQALMDFQSWTEKNGQCLTSEGKAVNYEQEKHAEAPRRSRLP